MNIYFPDMFWVSIFWNQSFWNWFLCPVECLCLQTFIFTQSVIVADRLLWMTVDILCHWFHQAWLWPGALENPMFSTHQIGEYHQIKPCFIKSFPRHCLGPSHYCLKALLFPALLQDNAVKYISHSSGSSLLEGTWWESHCLHSHGDFGKGRSVMLYSTPSK